MKNNFIKITKLSSGNLIIHHAEHLNFAKVHFLYLRKKLRFLCIVRFFKHLKEEMLLYFHESYS